MKIDNNTAYQNRKAPAFTAIKAVRYEGLYKKYPEYNTQLLSALKENPIAVNFFKKYDVDIVFHAINNGINNIKSSIHIFYENPSKNKFQKFLQFFTARNEDSINLPAWGKSYVNSPLEESTQNLINYLLPETKGKSTTGVLSAHLENADKKIQAVLDKKAQKQAEKLAKKTAAEEKAAQIKSANDETANAVNEFMNSINK